MLKKIKAYFELRRARAAYQRAEAACHRALNDDAVSGLYEALSNVRFQFGEDLIDAEVYYLRLVA